MENEEQVEQTVTEETPVTEEQTGPDQQESPEIQENKQADKSEAENIIRLRAKTERTERERDEAIRLLKEVHAQQQTQSQSDKGEEDFNINPDELVEGKHLNKFNKKIKRLEEQVKNYQNQSEQYSVESRLKAQYQDFDKVVNNETISVLREQYPELADTISNSPNLYNKAVTAYTLIKKLNIAPDDTYQNDRALAQKNSAKPRSLTSLSPQQGDSPLSKANAFANGLTDELKVQLRKEMDEARKNS